MSESRDQILDQGIGLSSAQPGWPRACPFVTRLQHCSAARPFVPEYPGHSSVRLPGTPDQIAKIAKEYRVYYKKIPTSDGGYVMDHSAIIYLMGPSD